MGYNDRRTGSGHTGQSNKKAEVARMDYIRLTDDNYVEMADEVLGGFSADNIVTSTQLRNLLSMISNIYNDILDADSTIEDEKNDSLIEEITSRINYLKVKFIYEAGRDEKVKYFIERANILNHLKDINKSKKNFILFSRYMEALVAYRKYYFKDK